MLTMVCSRDYLPFEKGQKITGKVLLYLRLTELLEVGVGQHI